MATETLRAIHGLTDPQYQFVSTRYILYGTPEELEKEKAYSVFKFKREQERRLKWLSQI
jgi:hypothetical protein